MKALIISALVVIGLGAAVYMFFNSNQSSTSIGAEIAMQQSQSSNQTNKDKGQEFLAANKVKPGVVTLPSGLQYKILAAGQGPKPSLTDTVTVNYAGTLINGTEFDSSYKRGTPASFILTQVIPGWTEALQLMSVGSTWELYIPAYLAYGVNGAAPVIGPNETLIFKVELIAIKKSA
jgi:FKBP-type peptidyl-prolyl cis-trans isomerase FklB